MKQTRFRLSAAMVALTVAGCGGGGSGGGPITPAPGKQSNGNATFIIKIPAKAAAAASKRIAHYVTANVKAIDFNVQASGAQSIFSASSYVFYPLVPQASYCTSGTSGLTCTVQVNAPPGSDVFTTNLYDGTTVGLSNIIATGTLTQTISSGVANTIAITTNGQPQYIVVGSTNPFPSLGVAASIPLAAQVTDADGDVIVGSFDLPVTATNSDTSGATTISKTTFAQNSDFTGVSIAYSGATISAGYAQFTFNGTYPSVTGTTSSPIGTFNVAPGSGAPAANPGYLYFANAAAAPQTITVSGGFAPYTIQVNTCNGYLTIAGTSPTFTVTATSPSVVLTPYPAVGTGFGVCAINVVDYASRMTPIQVLIGN